MNTDNGRKHKLIGLSILGLLFVGAIVFLLSLPGSGDEVATSGTADGTGTSTALKPQPAVQYSGFSDLAKRGVTSFQMEGIKYALYQHAKSASKFTIDPATIAQPAYDRDNPTSFVQLTFALTIDKKAYTVRVDKYTDLVTVRVYLFESGSSQAIYDSQPIDSRKLKATDESIGG